MSFDVVCIMVVARLDSPTPRLDSSTHSLSPTHKSTTPQVVFPDHVPEDVHENPINIDMTPVVKGEKGDGRVLVDSANKTYFAN